jgi:hypothetical protein
MNDHAIRKGDPVAVIVAHSDDVPETGIRLVRA